MTVQSVAPEGILVRVAVRGDEDVIAAHNVALARETEEKALDLAVTRAGVARVLDQPCRGRFWLGLDAAGEIVGQAMVTFEWSDWRNTDIWWLQSIYVRAAHRRRGVLRALHAQVQREAEAAGAFGMRLYMDRANEVARRAYERLGYVASGYVIMELSQLGAGD